MIAADFEEAGDGGSRGILYVQIYMVVISSRGIVRMVCTGCAPPPSYLDLHLLSLICTAFAELYKFLLTKTNTNYHKASFLPSDLSVCNENYNSHQLCVRARQDIC